MHDDWNRPTRPGPRDLHYRHGLLMAEVQKLTERVEALEHLFDSQVRSQPRRSIRPTVERIGVSAIVAGVVAGVVQGLAQFFR